MQLTESTSGPSQAASRITAASRRPSSLGATPGGAIALSMGEPDSGTPTPVVTAAIDALHAGRTRYTALTGAPALRDALAQKLSRGTWTPVTTDQVVITHGGSAGLAATMLAVLNPGDRVLIPEPTYSLYADHAAMVGAEVTWVPNRADGGLDLERLGAEAANAAMVVICNPGNPTGRVYSADDIEALEELLAAHPHLLLLSDEAYSDITFDDVDFRSALSIDAVRDQVILCSTFSKSYAMTGWRLGYVVAAASVAAQINLLHRTINGSVNTFVQDAALVALDISAEALQSQAASYQLRRDIVTAQLGDISGVRMLPPQGAFYAFVHIDSDLTSDEMTARFAEGGVIVRSGSEFGPSGEGHVRLSFATDPATLRGGLARFTTVLAEILRPQH